MGNSGIVPQLPPGSRSFNRPNRQPKSALPREKTYIYTNPNANLNANPNANP